MVIFLPFPGFRPSLKDGEGIENRISPPYDVIGDDYLKELQSRPGNVTLLTLKPDEDKRYRGSRKTLDSWIADGTLVQDDDSFYLYKQTFDDHGVTKTRTGFVGRLKTEKYEEGNIIPHEETFSKVKADRLNLLRDMETHLESIFGIFRGFSSGLIADINKTAVKLYEMTDDTGVKHEYFRIGDKDVIAKMCDEIKDQKMLIADGHHRYETALNYSLENPGNEKKAFVLATLVPMDDEGLVIWPTHRMIAAEDIGENTALKKITKNIPVIEVSKEEMLSKLGDYHFGLLFRSGKCMLAKYDAEGKDPIWNLDTYIAQEIIMNGIYKADEGKSKIAYDAELDSVLKKMESKQYDVAIILNHPSLKSIWDLAAIGKRMPKKTTFFFPKIWSGFVFYRMV